MHLSFRSLSPLTRQVVAGCTGALALAATLVVGMRVGADRERARDEWADGRLLSTAIDSVRANALDSLPSDELIRRAVSGMLREIHDPYAALLRPDSYRSYRGSLLGEGQGMGLSLRLQGTLLSVRRVAEGSPAATAGVHRGDRILAWNGVSVDDRRPRTTSDSTRARSDSTDLLLWRAPFGDTMHVAVKRATWHAAAVTESGFLSDSIGYVRLATISQHASQELAQAIERLDRRGARQLVLDLRGNGGGLLEEGVKAASLFLPKNAVVTSVVERGGRKTQLYRATGSRWSTLPLVLLVDAGTASAAEIIVASLREHGRALLVGAPTYGKGVVQRVVRLSPDLSLRLTTARWLTPHGHMLERRTGTGRAATGGIMPDVWLDDAGVHDPAGVPHDWSTASVARTVAIADTAAMRALREGWSITPMPLLEERMRSSVVSQRSRMQSTNAPSAQWATVATRLATVKMLETQSLNEELVRYAARDDAAIRSALELLVGGGPSSAAQQIAGDSLHVTLPTTNARVTAASTALDVWLGTHYRAMQLLSDSARATRDYERDALWPRVESVGDAAQSDTLFAVQFDAVKDAPALRVGSRVRLTSPAGGAAATWVHVVTRRAFRAPRRAGPSVKDDGFRYGWAYLALVSRDARATTSIAYRGWLLADASDIVRRR